MSVTYTAVLDVSEDSVRFLSGLLARERVRRGTRTDSRSSSTDQQAVLVLRWLFDDTRMAQLARDNDIGLSTAYDHRDEAIAVLAARKPSLHGALLAAKAAGHTHVLLDGTLICTDRTSTPGRPAGWICGGRASTATPAATSRSSRPPTAGRCGPPPVRPGREHDTTAARADPELLTQLTAGVDDGQLGLADLGYEGEVDTLRIPIKKTAGSDLSCDQQAYNAASSQVLGLLPGQSARPLPPPQDQTNRGHRHFP